MPISSGQITQRLKHSTNVADDKQKIFEGVRYFIAQRPASNDYVDSGPGWYRGRHVIHGPKANPKLGLRLDVQSIHIAEQRYFIRFVDNLTTDGADEEIIQALYTIMDESEADEYEKILKGDSNGDNSERVSGSSTK